MNSPGPRSPKARTSSEESVKVESLHAKLLVAAAARIDMESTMSNFFISVSFRRTKIQAWASDVLDYSDEL